MRCPSCNYDNPGDASFCEGCGAKLELICPACKAPVSPGARFCKRCGTAIGDAHAAGSFSESQIKVAGDSGSASEAIDGERKTVTALFADIKGSTELMRDLDPEEARAIVQVGHRGNAWVRRLSCVRRRFARCGDEVADLVVDPRATITRAGHPRPVRSKAVPVPPDHRLGLDDGDRIQNRREESVQQLQEPAA